jgi:hypothetical protein
MIGVVLIFFWGPPQPAFDEYVAMAVEPGTVFRDGTKASDVVDATKRWKRLHQIISGIGLALVFFGFGFQLLAVWVDP